MGWHATKRQISYIRVLTNRLGWGNDPDVGIIHVLGHRPRDGAFGNMTASHVISELAKLRRRTGANHPVKNLPKSYKIMNRKRREKEEAKRQARRDLTPEQATTT